MLPVALFSFLSGTVGMPPCYAPKPWQHEKMPIYSANGSFLKHFVAFWRIIQ